MTRRNLSHVWMLAPLAAAISLALSACAPAAKPAVPPAAAPAAKPAVAATQPAFVTPKPGVAATRPAVATTKPARPKIERFESTIQGFEKKDQANPPAAGGTLFVGSSTFALWKSLETDFADVHAINRGFGGSTTPEVIRYAKRIVLPYKPAKIVFYCGENDVASGDSVEQVLASFRQFLELVHRELPQTHVYYLPMKTSASRLKYAATFEKIRTGVKDLAVKTPYLHYIDIVTPLMDGDQPRAEYYLADKLHLNRAGYELIIPIIREALKR